MRNKFQEMQQQMQEKMKDQQGYKPQPAPKTTPSQVSGDYIDFEEVK